MVIKKVLSLHHQITLKLNKMTKIKNRLNGLDKLDVFGIVFGIVFLIPSIVAIFTDIYTNGCNIW